VSASAAGFAESSVAVDPAEGGFRGEVEIELRGAVPCAGLCDLTAFALGDDPNDAWMWITGPGDGGWATLQADDLRGDGIASFQVEGLQPGSYQAHLWYSGQQAETLSFELPEGGDEGLVLVFVPEDGRP